MPFGPALPVDPGAPGFTVVAELGLIDRLETDAEPAATEGGFPSPNWLVEGSVFGVIVP